MYQVGLTLIRFTCQQRDIYLFMYIKLDMELEEEMRTKMIYILVSLKYLTLIFTNFWNKKGTFG